MTASSTRIHGNGRAPNRLEVIPLCRAVGIAKATLENSRLPDNRKHPLLVSLDVACESFDRGDFTDGIGQLTSFENKVHAQVQDSDPDLAQTLLETVHVILNALGAH